MNNKIIAGIIGVVVIAGGAFYGGMIYGKNTVSVRGQFASGQFTGNQNGTRSPGVRGGMNGFTTGEIISNNTTSITVKMQDGSTKIALIASSTEVMKSSTGLVNDLVVGTSVVVNGTTNNDGSITAQNIQIRPAGSPSTRGRIN